MRALASDLLFGFVGAAGFAGLLAATEWLRARYGARPALLRKIPHLGAGVLALVTPAWLSSGTAALVLAICLTAGGAAGIRAGLLPVLADARGTGSRVLYFGAATALLAGLFWEAQITSFLAGTLVLALGDGLAGLVGEVAGRHRYTIGRNTRSLEGSLTMLVVSMLVLTALLLHAGGMSPARAFAAATGIAALATAVEAASPGASDNLWVPLVTACAVTCTLAGG